jgi:hypothetical protein
MKELVELPAPLGTAAIGAVIAALGYLAKLAIELVTAARREGRERRSALIRLSSLLRASRVAFEVQNELAQRLLAAIRKNYPDVDTGGGYEHAISHAYDRLSEDERELHTIIRGYTIHALQPTNNLTLDWVREDTYFKVCKAKGKLHEDLVRELAQLEAHLPLWLAKFESLIPDHPHHALVYMDDELKHGLPFPHAIDQTVAQLLAS